MEYLSAEEVKAAMQGGNVVVLDIREPYELEICSIDALKIPMADVANRVNEIPKDKTVAVLCRSGRRAAAVTNMLNAEFGFNNVKVLEGGILAWIEKIEPHLEAY